VVVVTVVDARVKDVEVAVPLKGVEVLRKSVCVQVRGYRTTYVDTVVTAVETTVAVT
jgi:hypothetical protein